MDRTRLCTRPACGAPATASLSFDYADRVAWIDDLHRLADPATYDLCQRHADRLGVPLGWTRDDRRRSSRPATPLFGAEARLAV